MSSPSRAESFIRNTGNFSRGSQSHPTSVPSSEFDIASHISSHRKMDALEYSTGCLNIGGRGSIVSHCIFPSDLAPFTRRPIFLVIDSDSSKAFKAISGAGKGEPVAMLLSPNNSLPLPGMDSSRQPSGSPFTTFLTAPLQAFILLLGFLGSDIEMDAFNKAEKLLSSSLNEWGSLLATSNDLNSVWTQILSDPFLRRLLLRFIFCRAALMLYAPTFNKAEYVPESVPSLPDSFLPSNATCQRPILQLASIFGAANRFIFSEEITPS